MLVVFAARASMGASVYAVDKCEKTNILDRTKKMIREGVLFNKFHQILVGVFVYITLPEQCF